MAIVQTSILSWYDWFTRKIFSLPLALSRLPTVLLLLDPIFYMGCPPGRYFVVETFRK